MVAFVQLAIFGFVLDFVVYRQTSTVVYTPQVALTNCGKHGQQAFGSAWHVVAY